MEIEDSPDWIGVIHYDTLQGLKKKGIVVYEKPANAKAFPGYSEMGCYIPKNR